MSKSKSKKFKIFFIIIPLIISIAITWFSAYLFEQNRIQTYEAVQLERENEIKSIVRAVDNLVGLTSDKKLTDEQKEILKMNVVGINSQEGVHCYLMDKELNFISEYNDDMTELDNHVLYALRHCETLKDDIKALDNGDNSDNYFKINVEDHGEYEFYWQRVPTENTEFFIIVGVSLEKTITTEATHIYKIFITSLNIITVVSIYANIYLYERLKEEEN